MADAFCRLHLPKYNCAYFKINVANARNNIIYAFADISQLSSFPKEEETLFC
jgi:hypothetical protein